MCFLTRTDHILDGRQSASQSNPHPQRCKVSELQPGERGPENAKPHCLPNNGVRFHTRIGWKTHVEEIGDGQCCARKRNEPERKETPTRPDQRWNAENEDQQCQPAPAHKHQKQSREQILPCRRCLIHRMNYTRSGIAAFPVIQGQEALLSWHKNCSLLVRAGSSDGSYG